MLALKRTFLIKNEYSKIDPVVVKMHSEIKNQGTMPTKSQIVKGILLFVDGDLNPNVKTNHITPKVTKGWMKAHIKPKTDPKYFCVKSLLISLIINLFDFLRSLKKGMIMIYVLLWERGVIEK